MTIQRATTVQARRFRNGRRATVVSSIALATALLMSACGSGNEVAGEPRSASTDDGATDASCPVDAHEDVDGVTEITIWHAWVGITKATLERTAEEYNAAQDKVRVNVEAQGNYEELLAKYEQSIGATGSLPNIVNNEESTLRFMVDSGTAIPAQACIDNDPEARGFYDQVLPAVIANYSVEDVLWPAAFSVSQAVIYVNGEHFEAAGLSMNELPETLDDIRVAAEAIAAADIPGVQEPFVGLMDSWFFENQLTGVGQEIVDNDNGRDALGTRSQLVNEASSEVLDWLAQLHDDGLYRPVPYNQPFDSLLAMALGTSSMLIETSTAITSIDAAFQGTLDAEDLGAEDLGIDLSGIQLEFFDVGIAPNPGLEAPGRGRIGGAGWFIVDTGEPAEVAAAWDFLKFSNRTENQVRWTLDGSYLPVSEAARTAREIVEEFEGSQRGNWLAIASTSLDLIDPDFPGPVIGPYNQLKMSVRSGIEQMILSGVPADEVLARIDAEFQQELDDYAADVGA